MSQSSDAPLVESPNIEHLSPSTYIFRPDPAPVNDNTNTNSQPTSTSPAPNLILLFPWTGAQPQHIAKYTSGYTLRFPSTPIMVIQTFINDLIYRTSSKRRQSLLPAITTILSSSSSSSSSSNLTTNILLHAFSEGGSSTSVQFAKAYLSLTRTRLPIAALILDSCPGTLHLSRLASTARKTCPGQPQLQTLASIAAYAVIATYLGKYLLMGTRDDRLDDPHDLNHRTKRALDDAALWPTTVPRAYLFSKADALIAWRSVLGHARRSERRGTPIFVEVFEESKHCAHIRDEEGGDKKRYWAAVERVWEARVSGRRKGEGVVFGKGKDGVQVKLLELGLADEVERKLCRCSDCVS